MTLKGCKYQELSDKLAQIGVHQTADNLRNKVNKGILGADLLMQIMYVMQVSKVEKDRIEEIVKNLWQPWRLTSLLFIEKTAIG